jgi:glutathione-regulated potassium-efflux system ancillary protein KefG
MTRALTKTLILLFHPALEHSRANAQMIETAGALPSVTVINMYGLYPDGRMDADVEAARLLGADRIVLQFPVQWYSTPSLLKEWQDRILTRMFYIDYDNEGRLLEGRPLLVAATAGNVAAAYGPAGRNLYPLPELLKPLRATANRCGLPWAEPFLLFEANKLDDAALREAGRGYARHLAHWMGHGVADEIDCPGLAPCV